jgi:predicted glutamine amidotransferase
MCLIIYTRAPTKIGHKVLENVQNHNPDGFGGLFYDGGRIVVERALPGSDGVELFLAMAKEAEEAKSPLAFHFRKRTTGEISLGNCHPIPAGSGVLMHNGTLDALRPGESDPESDSVNLGRLVASLEEETGKTPMTSAALRRTVSLLAKGNRVLYAANSADLAAGAPRALLLNPGLWTWIGAHCFSNLYSWDAYRLTQGRYGTKESEKEREKRKKQLSLF